MTLGQALRDGRSRKGFSLREVERQVAVSNGHLSLIESGAVLQPSPNLLERLAALYGVSYGLLMELAGYRVPEPVRRSVDTLRELGDLSEGEIEQVRRFVGYLKASRDASSPPRGKRR